MENPSNDADYYFLKGEEEKEHDRVKSIAYYEKALDINPNHEEALFAHGETVFAYVWEMMWNRAGIVQFIRNIDKILNKRAIDYYKRGVGWEVWCLYLLQRS